MIELLLGVMLLILVRIAEALERIAVGLNKEEPPPFDYHAEEEKARPRVLGSFFRSNKDPRRPGEGDDER